ncbi:hypothetical protein V8G54_027106 [Vigna mungo]|uniref:Uncharacterized protein n=1 Tax=Vigna mungo TaxID=3915 RepID=A0AAQ3RNS4_VIGMU
MVVKDIRDGSLSELPLILQFLEAWHSREYSNWSLLSSEEMGYLQKLNESKLNDNFFRIHSIIVFSIWKHQHRNGFKVAIITLFRTQVLQASSDQGSDITFIEHIIELKNSIHVERVTFPGVNTANPHHADLP